MAVNAIALAEDLAARTDLSPRNASGIAHAITRAIDDPDGSGELDIIRDLHARTDISHRNAAGIARAVVLAVNEARIAP